MWVYHKDKHGRFISGQNYETGEYAVPFTNGQTGERTLVYYRAEAREGPSNADTKVRE